METKKTVNPELSSEEAMEQLRKFLGNGGGVSGDKETAAALFDTNFYLKETVRQLQILNNILLLIYINSLPEAAFYDEDLQGQIRDLSLNIFNKGETKEPED